MMSLEQSTTALPKCMILRNGIELIIGIESIPLLGYSVVGLFTSWFELKNLKEILYKEAIIKLKEFVYNDDEMQGLVQDFIDALKSDSNAEERTELVTQLSILYSDLSGIWNTSLQVIRTVAAVETALATKKLAAIMEQQQKDQSTK